MSMKPASLENVRSRISIEGRIAIDFAFDCLVGSVGDNRAYFAGCDGARAPGLHRQSQLQSISHPQTTFTDSTRNFHHQRVDLNVEKKLSNSATFEP
jgi:hypothetical protein